MSSLKFRPAERRRHSNDPIPFPGPVSRIGRWAPSNRLQGERPTRAAEEAIERVQRRLENLRATLGPDYGRDDDGPKAA